MKNYFGMKSIFAVLIFLSACNSQTGSETSDNSQTKTDTLQQQREKISYLGILSKSTRRLSLFKIIGGKAEFLWDKGVFYPTGVSCDITKSTSCPENAASSCGKDCQFIDYCVCVRNTMTSNEGKIYVYCWCEDGPKLADGEIPDDTTIIEI